MKIYDRSGLRKVNQTIVPTQFEKGAQWVNVAALAINLPTNDVDVIIPYTCVLKECFILTAGGIGSCVVDIWSAPLLSFPPTSANDITGGSSPSIAAGITLDNSVLAGWTTSFNAQDVVRFHLHSVSVFTRVLIVLRFQ